MTGPGPQAIFESALREGRLRLPYCTSCGRFSYPPGRPAARCPHDPKDYVWRDAAPRGAVHAVTVARRKPERGGDVGIALIDLQEGVRVMAACEPGRLGPDMPVRLSIDGSPDEPRLLAMPEADGER